MKGLSASETLRQVAEALPEDCREYLVVVGSLAAAYHFFGGDPDLAVRTKDVDCILKPFHLAVDAARKIALRLLDLGWRHRALPGDFAAGTSETQEQELPVIRLVPPLFDPGNPEWFIELLCVPEDAEKQGRQFTRIDLGDQHFVLPSFQFMAVTTWRPFVSETFRIRYARPSMMALANLLAHPKIGAEPMSAPIGGRFIKRANKDLGRVLALAKLSDLDDYEPWGVEWLAAVEEIYGTHWRTFCKSLGSGLRELLNKADDMEEAMHTCNMGLLVSVSISSESLMSVGRRLLAEAVEYVEEKAGGVES